ncbi:MAG: hypothetical protein IJ184_07265 [Alphaproteobacteria bacterium]|nr:hypothetical protein [Alphaproteobacteria bacterium]
MAKFDKQILAKYGFLGGRPKSFKSPKEMLGKMAEFLASTEGRVREIPDKNGGVKVVASPAPVTLEDFCCFAGITKTTFYEYAKKPEYKNLCDNFRQAVEAYWVRQCAEGNAGNKADFILKNSFAGDWKDNKEVTLNAVEGINIKVIDGQNSGD